MCKGVVRVPESISSKGEISREEVFVSRIVSVSACGAERRFLMIFMAAPQFVYRVV